MSVTLNDIAARSGFSVSTVSRVLNDQTVKYRISRETKAAILQVAHELNYRANHVARGLRTSKTYTIGVLAPDISNPFFAHIIKRVQSAALAFGYSIIVCNTDENTALEVEQVNLLHRKRVDGLIAMPVGLRFDHLQEWLDKGLALVTVDRCFEQLQAPSIGVDNYLGARQAVAHLAAAGHTRIAIIQGLPGTYTSIARLRGYRDALEAHGIPLDDSLVVGGDFREENGYLETKLLMSRDDRPTALFATSDLITLGVLTALAEEGLQIPADVSLVCFDDLDFAPHLKCPLTVVSQPRGMIGEMAVKLLVDQLEGSRREARQLMLPPSLVVRESVAAPAFVEA